VNQDFIQLAIDGVMSSAISSGLFVSLATIQAPSQDFDSAGAWDGTYADVPGLVDIPCMAPPPSDARIQATENRALEEIASSEWHHVLLNGWYPTIDEGWRGDGTPAGSWRMMIDGYPYEIAGVESDSQTQMTRLTARLTTI
jgi:hypothetical protein